MPEPVSGILFITGEANMGIQAFLKEDNNFNPGAGLAPAL